MTCMAHLLFSLLNFSLANRKVENYPIKNYRGQSPNYRRKRWVYVHLIRGAANHPIIVHYEACKGAYLCILISEESTNKEYEEKMHIDARKIIFLKLFQWGK